MSRIIDILFLITSYFGHFEILCHIGYSTIVSTKYTDTYWTGEYSPLEISQTQEEQKKY